MNCAPQPNIVNRLVEPVNGTTTRGSGLSPLINTKKEEEEMKRKEQRSMLALAIVIAFVVGVFWAGPVGAGNLEPTGPQGPIMHMLDEIYEVVVDTNSKVNGGSCEGAPVEKTGQTASYVTGDDGDLEKGVAWPNPRFTDNGDGTVTDNLTGLIWLKNANCFGIETWDNALSECNNLASESCGLMDGSVAGDWRLPNVKELQSLIHYGVYHPALPDTAGTGKWIEDDPFSGVVSSYYWSSTTLASTTGNAWYVTMSNGYVGNPSKSNSFYVWPVRGGQ